MAVENARAFLDDLCNNAALRTQYNATGAANINVIMDFALSKGYVFAESDLRGALREYPQHLVVDHMRSTLRVAKAHNTAPTT